MPSSHTCSRCGERQDESQFNRDKNRPNGLYPVCKTCRRELLATEKEAHPERVIERGRRAGKRYRDRHRERLRERGRELYGPRDRERHRVAAAARRARTPEQHVLHGLKQRCRDENHWSYAGYGGRGITVSEVFDGPRGLERFLECVGRRPSDRHTIERIDNDRGYEPGNIRWATMREQSRNKRNNRIIEFRGKRLCLVDWQRETGIPHELIRARIDRLGWTVARALTTPVRRKAS